MRLGNFALRLLNSDTVVTSFVAMSSTKRRREVESKFLLDDPGDQVPKLLRFLKKQHIKVGKLAKRTQVDRYFDTGNWDLFRAGWAYRYRESARRRNVELKSLQIGRGEGLHDREEIECRVKSFPEEDLVVSSVPLSGDLAKFVEDCEATLKELFQVSTERRIYRGRGKNLGITICVDDARIVKAKKKGGRSSVMRFHELELELVDGNDKQLRKLALRIEKEVGLLPAMSSKFERGIWAADLTPVGGGGEEVAADARKGMSLALLAHQFLGAQFRALLANEAMAFEGLHSEGVHQMRVASRRLRVGLEVFREWLPEGEVQSLRKEVKRITKSLGEVRDLDVFREAVSRDAEIAGVEVRRFQAHLADSWRSARKKLVRSISSARYRRFKEAFAAFLDNEVAWSEARGSCSGENAAMIAGAVLIPALCGLLATGDRIGFESPDSHLHDLRLGGKRFRYRLELFSPVVPGGLKRFVKATKVLQDRLGDHQDACVALERIDRFADSERPKKADRKELAKLRKIVECRRSALRNSFPDDWDSFESRVSKKRLRKTFAA